MKKEKLFNKSWKILWILLLIFSSIYITNKVREQFPSIKIQEQSLTTILPNGTAWTLGQGVNMTLDPGKSELHGYCSEKFSESSLTITIYSLDQNSVRIGDSIMVTSNIESEGDLFDKIEVFSGINKDELKKVHKGITDLDLIYFNGKNITTYRLSCFNLEDFAKYNGTVVSRNNFTRPSFVDSKVGFTLIFITVFVLIGQFIELIFKILNRNY